MQKAAEDPRLGDAVWQMSKLLDNMQKGFFSFRPGESWAPSVNLYENESAYIVCVELAWVDKEQIDLHVVDGQLRLKGSRAIPIHPDIPNVDAKRWRVHLMEIDSGPFCRTVQLPEGIDSERINATYRDGLLWIEVPKINK